MKKLLFATLLSIFTASVTFAAFPVKESSETITVVETKASPTTITKEEKKAVKEKIKNEAKDQKTAGTDNNVAIVLALVSVLILPFGLHNWYLGRKKQAIWQTVLMILIIPAIVSWIWQLIDLFKLLGGGLD